MKMRKIASATVALGILGFGCATHQARMDEPLRLIRQGHPEEAAQKLEPLAKETSKDQLLYLMEYGMALHIAGRYEESNKIFLMADKMTDDVDYYSVSRIVGSALTSAEVLQYKGESYEKLLINSYMALNYLMLGVYDDAMVEVRRIDDKVKKFRANGRPDYEQNPFANYLAALIWEGDQKYDDSYIEFERAYQLDKMNSLLPFDLVRSAKLSRRTDAYEDWKKKFPQVEEDPTWYDKKWGQVIVIVEQGWGPRKVNSRHDRRLPTLIPQRSFTQSAEVRIRKAATVGPTVNGKTDGVTAVAPLAAPSAAFQEKIAVSKVVYNVEQVSMRTLDADLKYIVARNIGSTVAKAVLADQIRQKNEALGIIAYFAMAVSDRADLRQWSSLPETFQVARISVPAGDYEVSIQGLSGTATATADMMPPRKIKVVSGRKSFLAWRSIQ